MQNAIAHTPLLSLFPQFVCIHYNFIDSAIFVSLIGQVYSSVILRLLILTEMQHVFRQLYEFAFPIHTQINKTVHFFCVYSLLINLF